MKTFIFLKNTAFFFAIVILLSFNSCKKEKPVLYTTNNLPTDGLVGWWPFNGNANDESGNGNNGTVNGASLTTDRNGSLNSAYSFNGVSSIKVNTPSFTVI